MLVILFTNTNLDTKVLSFQWNKMESLYGKNDKIDFYKYLNCPNCKKSGLYCQKHRVEVEQILKQN